MVNKQRLLIVDDQLGWPRSAGEDTRRQLYEKLSSLFDISFLENPSALPALMQHGEVDAALVDFVLEEWGIDVSSILRVIDERVPVSLISNFWTPNFDSLRRVMEDYRISRLFTWDEMASPEGRDLVGFWIDMAIRHQESLAPKSLQDDESFRLVQISDIQFGGDISGSFAIDTELALQAIETRWPGPPHVVALTGDIAELGRPSEYDEAQSWLHDFTSKISDPTSVVDVVTVPGNHDISWPLALAARVDPDPENRHLDLTKILCTDLLDYSLAPFRDFSSSVEPPERWSPGKHYWISGRYRYEGVILFGLNTCEAVDEWGKETRELKDKTVAALFSELRAHKRACPAAIVIGILHHPLYGGSEVLTNPDLLRKTFTEDLGTVLLLTGHVHTDDPDPLTTIGSAFIQVMGPTFSQKAAKRLDDTSRGFNLIEIKRASGAVVEVEITSFVFEHHGGVRLKKSSVLSRRSNGKLTQVETD